MLLLLIAGIVSVEFYGQSVYKFGHVNTQQIFEKLPEMIAVQEALNKASQQYENQLLLMQKEFQTKIDDYKTNGASFSELLKQMREQELNDLNNQIQQFQQSASQDLELQKNRMINPILERVQKAIEQVGVENGFIYIFDIGASELLYHSEKSTDVTNMVKTKLIMKS